MHKVVEHSRGQKAARFYDPDKYIIEVGENIKDAATHFIKKGLTEEKTAKRMNVPLKFIKACIK